MARNTLMSISLTVFVMLVLAVQAINDPTNSLLSPNSLSPTSSDSPPGKFVPDEDNHLQKHVFFFDQNQDGIVYPWETFQGFRAIGASIPLSTVSSILINAALSQKTRPGKPPSPLLPIEIKNIHLAKHGSDSGAYDAEGRFVPEKFEEIFSKHAHSHPGALKNDELFEMLKANREPNDIKGWIAAWTEWKILYDLGKDKDGLLQKDTVRAVYDGSLFVQWAKQKGSANKAALSRQED